MLSGETDNAVDDVGEGPDNLNQNYAPVTELVTSTIWLV